jgi:hypothetical protein
VNRFPSTPVAAVSIAVASIALCPQEAASQARDYTVDLGVARAEWLSPGAWATSAGLDYRLKRGRRAALVVGLSGIFNQFTPGVGLTRRQHIATVAIGGEFRAIDARFARTFVHSQVAGSYWWFRYSPRFDFVPPGHQFDAIGIINGIRMEFSRRGRQALSVRADVRATLTDDVTWSPHISVGVAF